MNGITIENAILYWQDHLNNLSADTSLSENEKNERRLAAMFAIKGLRVFEQQQTMPPIRQEWINRISAERDRQDVKWGAPQDNTYCEWGSILSKECGELCKELNELNFGQGDIMRMVTEAIQVAAVALAILEQSEHAERVTTSLKRR